MDFIQIEIPCEEELMASGRSSSLVKFVNRKLRHI